MTTLKHFPLKKHIPNTLTCLNLACGCLSVIAALKGHLETAAILIIISSLFDFCDGLSARMLHVASPIGKELDSLADVVSFGMAPAMISYTWLNRCLYEMSPLHNSPFMQLLPLIVLLVPALSAVRLARFNIDENQKESFLGLPTPANALFLGFLPLTAEHIAFLNNFWTVWGFCIAFSLLLVSRIWMLSLKFKDFKWQGLNIARYILILISVVLVVIFHWGAFPLIIMVYIIISLFYHALVKLQII